VARDGDRQEIGRARRCYRPHRLRFSDPPRDVGVARGRAGRNFAERLPNPLLERGPPHIQRHIEADAGRFDQADHLRDKFLETRVAADQRCLRKPVL
jgi:hypothetical protein